MKASEFTNNLSIAGGIGAGVNNGMWGGGKGFTVFDSLTRHGGVDTAVTKVKWDGGALAFHRIFHAYLPKTHG